MSAKTDKAEMVNVHEPLIDQGKDELGFSKSASFIAESIMGLADNESWVLGIEGAWGAGKSTLISFTEQELSSDGRVWRAPTIVRFNPWLIGNRKSVISHFFGQLADALDSINQADFAWWHPKRWLNVLRKARLRGRMKKLGAVASESGVSGDNIQQNIIISAIQAFIALFFRNPSVDAHKKVVEKLLSEFIGRRTHFRILVIVDDLDRLEPQEAVEVVRLVKAVANFPNVTYLLAYDKDVLAENIVQITNAVDGVAYLEKIIQYGFKVPFPSAFRLRNFFKDAVTSEFPDDADWSSHEATVVFDVWAGRLLSTPRDVVRISQAIKLMWPNIRGAASLIDLVWLEMIKEKASHGDRDLYSWVLNYVRSIEAIAIGAQVSQKEDSQKKLVSILINLGWLPNSGGKLGVNEHHFLGAILAGVVRNSIPAEKSNGADEIWLYRVTDQDMEKVVRQKRFTSPWHWKVYTALTQSDNALTDEIWSALEVVAKQNDLVDLRDAVSEAMIQRNKFTDAETRADQLLGRIESSISVAPETAVTWFEAIIDVADECYSKSRKTAFGFNKRQIDRNIEILCEKTLNTLAEVDRGKMLRDVFSKGRSVWALCEIYRDQYWAFNPRKDERPRTPYLSKSEFDLMTNSLKCRLRAIDAGYFASIGRGWSLINAAQNAFGDQDAKVWFSRLTLSNEALVGVLLSLETIQSSEQSTPGVPEKWLLGVSEAEVVKERLSMIALEEDSPLASLAEGLLDRWWIARHF